LQECSQLKISKVNILKTKNIIIRHQFESHIKFIKDILLSNISGIEAIILYGGYGRGEGCWIKSNDSYNPYNDYDILIILSDGVSKPNNLSTIKNTLLNKINIQWIDLSLIHLKSLLNNRNKTIFWYDLIHGSKVIYGDSNILQKIPIFTSSDIVINEGKLLFFTRLWPFVGGLNGFQDLSESEAIFFRYQMSKVILASVDMILLMRGLYVSSYVERCNNAIKICKKDRPYDEELINWALNQKLSPSNQIMTNKDAIKLQNRVAEIYANYSLKLLSQVNDKNFSSIIQFKEFYSNSFIEKSKIFAGFLLRKKTDYKLLFVLNILQLLIISNILGEISLDYTIKESNKLLKRLGFSSISDINSLKALIANERLS